MSMRIEGSTAEPQRDKPVPWRLIAAVVVAAVAILFIVQNSEKGTLEFLWWDWEVGTWFGLLVTFLLGMLAGWLLPRFIRKVREE